MNIPLSAFNMCYKMLNVSDSDRMETPVSVLQLELEELKKNMSSVQSEIGTCLTSLFLQQDRMCDVINRFELYL